MLAGAGVWLILTECHVNSHLILCSQHNTKHYYLHCKGQSIEKFSSSWHLYYGIINVSPFFVKNIFQFVFYKSSKVNSILLWEIGTLGFIGFTLI